MTSRLQMIALPVFVTAAVLITPIAPSPLGFWCALAAALLGPGSGIPRILFPKDRLSLPEKSLIIVLMSILIDATIFSVLNALGLALTAITVSLVLLSTTYISSLIAFIFDRSRDTSIVTNTNTDQPSWGYFACGVVITVVVLAGVLRKFV